MSSAASDPVATDAPSRAAVLVEAVVTGTAVLLAGTLPRNALFAANLAFFPAVPWAVPVLALYLWLFWRYLRGDGPPPTTSATRRRNLRATPLSGRLWTWALAAGVLGLIALVLGLRVANRLVALPPQTLPDLAGVPSITILTLLLAGAPVAGIVEESAFRGYMQGPLERAFGVVTAILISGTVFALVHLDFLSAPVLWPYYVAVAFVYGLVVYFTRSILPAIVLHTAGNTYSTLDLWLHGQAEWQAPASQAGTVWTTGVDAPFWTLLALLTAATVTAAWAYARLARAAVRGVPKRR
jgi:membrane protease YdiL (CAAX protease family)